MEYKALTYINLPFINVVKNPGDTITDKEFEDAQQTEDNINTLIKGGALSKDKSASIHPDHAPVVVRTSATEGAVNVVSGDVGVSSDSTN